ncbi:hypothetical protein SAMN02745857_01719 [Andreprevotia lacus DSM 23236]|uniref:Calcineurin-like phosphoesterase domain-containing protein n=1 Tax=Andreprevotia lacus DSM 23236 TaxID=1121001 RepID=A0A1W1XIQ8_9NEIS|nr:metallophosphoesterase [Andreprevotia lacus]SMC23866.1 hypothetical protein SAMN02745857_01719 [Andreprevotia lacus DSM 23236]
MRRFFLVAGGLSVLLHGYIAWRLLPALGLSTVATLLGALLFLLSAVLVPLGLLMSRSHRQPLADRLAWVGMLLMGLFSSLLVLTLLREPLLLAGWLFAPAGQQWAGWSAWGVLGLAILMTLVGFVNARRSAQVVDVDVPIAGLPAALEGFTIAQLSDIHVGPTIKAGYLQAIVERVNRLDADAIAITGDLVDGSVAALREHTRPLAGLRARHGVFFATGNHEYYSGAPQWIDELRSLGVQVLLNEHVVLQRGDASLLLAGITDYTAHQFDPAQRSDPQAALANAPAHAYPRIVLAHQPRSAPATAAAGFDMQLSGHTHGGQFWPWNHFVRLQQPYTAGLHRLDRLWIYISRGTGYWGPPKRFGAPSEITRLRLVSA